MSSILSIFFLAAAIPAMPPAPIGDTLPGYPKSPDAIIFEFTDMGGTTSSAKAKVTPESALSWCENWRAGTGENMQACAKAVLDSEAGRVYEASANCQTGDLWVDGKHYLFNGPDESSQFFAGYASVRDAETGKNVGMSNAEGGRELGAKWLSLCPMGLPYDVFPVQSTFKPGPDESLFGEYMGHNRSVMFHHEKHHVIVYSDPKPAIAGAIRPDTVLFRGWHVPGEWYSGVAYSFKKNCDPAPYLVSGHYQGGPTLTLRGKAPIRDGCKVVGYSDKGANANLVFDLAQH
ncbi:hypothetical protein [Rhizobium mongolense]|uniref:hypothetical protein n=1 Tax=Rhizobium mongolense TaxID=57676 RepID=UPI0034A1B14E